MKDRQKKKNLRRLTSSDPSLESGVVEGTVNDEFRDIPSQPARE